jgi:acetyltransferase-like isoleucine patch superfamily enzyme
MSRVVVLFKGVRKLLELLLVQLYTPAGKILLRLNGVTYGSGLKVNGLIKVIVTRRGKVNIGSGLRLNSGDGYNIIGRQQKCIFWVEGELTIGNGVGISSTAIICHHKISIGNNVVIGGNTVIYDTDFHALDARHRDDPRLDVLNAKWGQVQIGDSVFIGAHSTILKGTKIGDRAVVGACSVVSKEIPADETWAGNPAVFIRKHVAE